MLFRSMYLVSMKMIIMHATSFGVSERRRERGREGERKGGGG